MTGRTKLAFVLMTILGCSCAVDRSDTASSGVNEAPAKTVYDHATQGRDLDVRLERIGGGPGQPPSLMMAVRNISNRDVCLPADTLDDSESFDTFIELHDAQDQTFPYLQVDLIIAPRDALVTLKPGETITSPFRLDRRFKLPKEGLPNGSVLKSRASFLYSICGNSEKLAARSAWQSF